ncbi:transcription elongation factor [Vibrio coralliilyticus]|jgi:transcription elongation GreA/GreB family factor|uniref:Transcription elongation factor n=1 Tax=Vibrio coralliilyticus TaxID=190893 RepID=A0A7Y4BMC1_9VIBR|nr:MULTISPECIES: GreA/GreB family elongation factor [Vibrio]AXN31381.1 transcription elongation factor [Vibrio coralliilyticus]ERB62764.1 transcription elongation factor [Vibrio coralliilyticus OCN008]KFI10284.1 transcription elongation factor [Vibrio sp. B183]KJY75528.1 transcription elongation factor [Vibrio coralliilyticus]KPH27758.1 transcription elongation factor [Vibrio coralliilyticus]
MNKSELLQTILTAMQHSLEVANSATQRAIESATDEETVPEHKYDTLALEASYLAHGQAMRVQECERDLDVMAHLQLPQQSERITLGSLVSLIDLEDNRRWFFVAPCTGGLKVQHQQQEVMLVTFDSPLGFAMKGKSMGDEVEYQVATTTFSYEVDTII